MCQFYSVIVKRDLEVVDAVELDDSHETIIKKYKLKDNKLKNRDFVRLELMPKDKDIFNHEIANWGYKVDEQGTLPKWYKDKEAEITKKAYKKLKEVFKTQFLIGVQLKEFSGNVRYIKDSKIDVLKGKVGKMYDSSQVGEMYDSSQVGEMFDSSQVGEMFDSSRVGEMYASSQVGKMYDSSQVGETNGDVTINTWSSLAKVKKQGENTVVIKRGSGKPKVKIG